MCNVNLKMFTAQVCDGGVSTKDKAWSFSILIIDYHPHFSGEGKIKGV